MLYDLLRPLLFTLSPELAHGVAFRALSSWQALLQRRAAAPAADDALLSRTLWGLRFANPLGLAAGFDKNGALPHVWPALGFGFAELGTVTALAQPGNPAPRLFRLADERALINRLGFNNAGAAAVAQSLARRLAAGRPAVPLGINLGKSKLAPLEHAADDYVASLRLLAPLADYVAINVSSPNTPGLRDLQSEAQLGPLLARLHAENVALASARGAVAPPLLLKLAPDLADEALPGIVEIARAHRVAGLIATNTTISRAALPPDHRLAAEAGGLSGAPLRARATAVVRQLRRLTRGDLPIIGVGGVFSGADAYEKIRAGADLVQAYTGFIYGGPGFAPRVQGSRPATSTRVSRSARSRIHARRRGAAPPTGHGPAERGARQLAPQHRRQGEADEIVEGAARQIGIDQCHVDGARIGHCLQHGLLGDGVEGHALDRHILQHALLTQRLQEMPGYGFTLAIRVGCENELVGALHSLGNVGNALGAAAVGLPDHGEVGVRIDRAVLGGQVTHVTE